MCTDRSVNLACPSRTVKPIAREQRALMNRGRPLSVTERDRARASVSGQLDASSPRCLAEAVVNESGRVPSELAKGREDVSMLTRANRLVVVIALGCCLGVAPVWAQAPTPPPPVQVEK